MRNLLLSVALIAASVGIFAAGYSWLTPQTATAKAVVSAPSLGDMSAFSSIVTDVQTIANSGDLTAAGKRVIDLETVWDKAQASLQPISPNEWGYVDGAIDGALHALRTSAPDATSVNATLASLQTALADPAHGATGGTVETVSGITTTDANGHPLPCEAMLGTFLTTLATATLTDANRASVETLQAKGTERCNADDDARADDFFAQGIALMSK